jgi:hypothetical protein
LRRAAWLTNAGSGRLTFRYQLSRWRARASMRPGEHSSFVEVRDNFYVPSWLHEIVRTRRVNLRDCQWS